MPRGVSSNAKGRLLKCQGSVSSNAKAASPQMPRQRLLKLHACVPLRTAPDGVHPTPPEPGAKEDLALWRQGHGHVFVGAIGGGGKLAGVKQGKGRAQQGGQLVGQHPRGEVVQEGLQGLLVRRRRRGVHGACEEIPDEVPHERVAVRLLVWHRRPPLSWRPPPVRGGRRVIMSTIMSVLIHIGGHPAGGAQRSGRPTVRLCSRGGYGAPRAASSAARAWRKASSARRAR